MKKAKILSFLFLFLFIAPAFAAEKLEFQFDGRSWKAGYEVSKGGQSITEYILEGEKVEAWTELVTVQLFLGLQAKTTVGNFVNRVQQTLTARCPQVSWEVLEQGDDFVLYQWTVENCQGVEDQSEIAQTKAGKEAIHVLHYAAKKTALTPQKLETWKKILSETRFSAGPEEKKEISVSEPKMDAPSEELKTFEFKSGETIEGKILIERELYYQVEKKDGTRKVIFKRDLKT